MGLANLVTTDFFQHGLCRKMYSLVNQGQNIYFYQPQNFEKKIEGRMLV